MARGRVRTSDKIRASLSISKIKKLMELLPEFRDRVHLENEELDAALVGEVFDSFFTIGIYLLSNPNYIVAPPTPALTKPVESLEEREANDSNTNEEVDELEESGDEEPEVTFADEMLDNLDFED